MEAAAAVYPVALEVDYPERQSRWKTLFRLFLALPVFVFLAILSGGGFSWLNGRWWNADGGSPVQTYSFSMGAGGAIILAIWVAIVVRGYIPRWLFSFQVALMRFQARAYGYFALLTDVYPPFEGDYPIRFEVQYPEKLSRWKVLFWKIVTAIPHFVVLLFLYLAAALCVFVAWLVILFSGSCPREVHQFIAGVMRWSLRVQAYVFSLTDEYPPFSLADDAGPGSRDTYIVASIIGGLFGVLFLGGLAAFIALAVHGLPAEKVHVSYDSLVQDRVNIASTSVELPYVTVSLNGVKDPAEELVPMLAPGQGKRFIAFDLTIRIEDPERGLKVTGADFHLKDDSRKSHGTMIVAVNGRTTPVTAHLKEASVIAIFEIDSSAKPVELRYARPFFESFARPVAYELE